VDDVAHVAAREVHGHVVGDVARRHLQLDLLAHDDQRAAALEAGAVRVVLEAHLDEELHARLGRDAQKVHVGGQVLDDVALDGAADHALVGVALDLEVEERGQEVARLEALREGVELEVDGERRLGPSVDDARHAAAPAGLAGGPLARPRACRGDEVDLVGHGDLSCEWAALQGCAARVEARALAGGVPEGKPPRAHRGGPHLRGGAALP
jgi:hypothetical protein